MRAEDQETVWAGMIADEIERGLESYERGQIDAVEFVLDLEGRDPLLYDPANIRRADLRGAWYFADAFFSGAKHGDRDLAGIAWPVATGILRGVVSTLRAGLPVDDPRVLRYA